jgi:hypothetical protein
MIRQHALTDDEKIAGLERHIHRKYPTWKTYPQHYLLFTKGEDEFLGYNDIVTEKHVNKYKIHHPDMFIIKGIDDILIIELDGKIHNIKTKKTQERCDIYSLNNLPYIRINEEDLKFTLGIPKSNSLMQWQINDEFDRRLKCV